MRCGGATVPNSCSAAPPFLRWACQHVSARRPQLNRLLERFDGWASSADIEPLDAPHRPEPTIVPADAPLAIDLRRRGIETIIWATGCHPHCTWLELPVFDSHG